MWEAYNDGEDELLTDVLFAGRHSLWRGQSLSPSFFACLTWQWQCSRDAVGGVIMEDAALVRDRSSQVVVY
jgi:hypothetical protein